LRPDNTVFAFVSDHGEQFLEHGQVKHCRGLHEVDIRVPLALRLPGGPAAARVAVPVAAIDLVPTVIDYAGVSSRGAVFRGRSLRPLIESAAGATDWAARDLFYWQREFLAVSNGSLKLLRDHWEGRDVLFDVTRDPGERHDIAGEHPEEFHRMRNALTEMEREARARDATDHIERVQSIEERMRALGYLPRAPGPLAICGHPLIRPPACNRPIVRSAPLPSSSGRATASTLTGTRCGFAGVMPPR